MEDKDVFEIKKSKKWIFVLIFLVLLLGGIGYATYSFINYNEPKKALARSLYGLMSEIGSIVGIEDDFNKINVDTEISLEIKSNKENYLPIYSVINKLRLNTYFGYDKNDYYVDLLGTYDNLEIGNIIVFSKNKDNYVYLNDTFDKVIKLDNNVDEINTNSDDYKKLISYENDVIKKMYDKVEFISKYVKLGDRRVRRITLDNIKEIINYYFDELLKNNDYIELSSKISNVDRNTIIDKMNAAKKNLPDVDIAIYLSMLKNRFIKLDIINDNNKVSFEREKNVLSIKLFDNDIISYKLDFNINKDIVKINYSDIEEMIDIDVNISYKIDVNSQIKSKDVSSSIMYSEISEKDLNNIQEKIINKKGFISLMESISGEDKITL